MFCLNCGKELPEDANRCPFCGTPADKTIPKNVPVTAGAQVGVAANFAPPKTPKAPKSKKKLLITLLSVVSGVLVLTLAALVVKMPGTNKSLLLAAVCGTDMIEPGAMSERELIKTLDKNPIYSEAAVTLYSNSQLCFISNYGKSPGALSGKAERVLSTAENDISAGSRYIFSNIKIHIEEIEDEKLPRFYSKILEDMPENAWHNVVNLLESEKDVVNWVSAAKGYLEVGGKKYAFYFEDEAVLVINAGNRYYCAFDISDIYNDEKRNLPYRESYNDGSYKSSAYYDSSYDDYSHESISYDDSSYDDSGYDDYSYDDSSYDDSSNDYDYSYDDSSGYYDYSYDDNSNYYDYSYDDSSSYDYSYDDSSDYDYSYDDSSGYDDYGYGY